MFAYRPSSNQIIPTYRDHDIVSRDSGNRGETSPVVRNMLNSQYGRQLAGLGATEYGGDDDYEDDKLARMEEADDVVGSGIFDDAGASATVHPDMGVFADHPNLPGYLARETQFEPNESLVDLTTGGQVIAVPGGGMTNGGPLIGPGTLGPQLPYRYQSQLAPPQPLAISVPDVAPGSKELRAYPTPLVPTQPRFVAAPKAPCNCAPPPAPPVKRSLRGLGEQPAASASGSSWLPFVAGGLLLGAAVALVGGTMSSARRSK